VPKGTNLSVLGFCPATRIGPIGPEGNRAECRSLAGRYFWPVALPVFPFTGVDPIPSSRVMMPATL